MNNIQYLKLTTGDDIVSEIVKESDDILTLKNPIKIFMTADGLGMMPFDGFIKDNTVELKKEHIIFFNEPAEELYAAYDEQFGSGLIRPKNSNLQIVT